MIIASLNDLNKKYIQEHKTIYVGFIFLFAWLGLLLQHLCIGMYYDDFGNAALAYAYVVDGVNGTDFNIINILEWAKWIYLNWGGRIFYACAILIPLLKNGVTIYMVIQSIVILVILYLMYKMVCIYTKKESSIGISITIIIIYGLIDREMHVQGTYWASASILYIWPLLPMFITLLIYDKICKNIAIGAKASKRLYIIEIICIALTTLSQEQYGVALIVYYIVYIMLHHAKELKKFFKVDILCLLWSVITYMTMFCSPGNFVRMDTSETFADLSFVGKINRNLPIILDMYLKNSLQIFNLLTVLATFLMVLFLVKKDRRNLKNIVLSITTVSVGIMMLLTMKVNGYELIKRIICFIFLLNTALIGFRYFALRKKAEFVAIVVMAATSTFCLLMSPSVMHRSFLCYIFCVGILVTAVFWEFYYELNLNRRIDLVLGVLSICVLVLFGVKAINNVKNIFVGYYENKYAVDYNDKKLRNSSMTNDKEIILLKYPNSKYRCLMPCDKGYEYIEYWMKEYYDISQDVKFMWISNKNLDNYVILGASTLEPTFGEGTYELEEEAGIKWHWCEDKGQMVVNNPLDKEIKVGLICEVYTAVEDEAEFRLKADNEEEKVYDINKEGTKISYTLTLLPGDNGIYFSTNAQKMDLSKSNDTRKIFCGVRNWKVILK